MEKRRKIQVNQHAITVIVKEDSDFISLTDMTIGFPEGSGLIGKWITNKNTLEYGRKSIIPFSITPNSG